MTMRRIVALAVADRAACIALIETELVAMGWTLHDDQLSGSNYVVYYSDGESDKPCYWRNYLKLNLTVANKIQLHRYYFWNNSTHAGLIKIGGDSYNFIITSESPFYFWMTGNKDFLSFITKVAASYYGTIMARISCAHKAIAKLGASVTTGLVKVLQLGKGQAQYFTVGAMVSIWDTQNSSCTGRSHKSIITAVDRVNHTITVDQIYLAFQAGAIVGYAPDPYILMNFNALQCYTASEIYTTQGTANISGYNACYELFDPAFLDPDNFSGAINQGPSNLYIGSPLMVKRGTGGTGLIGFLDNFLLKSPFEAVADYTSYEDTVCIGIQQEETLATSGSTTALNDTGQSWTVNEFVDKVVIITTGTGAGQMRLITANSATALTPDVNFSIAPDSTSYYVICDEGWRHWGFASAANTRLSLEVGISPRVTDYFVTTTTTTV